MIKKSTCTRLRTRWTHVLQLPQLLRIATPERAEDEGVLAGLQPLLHGHADTTCNNSRFTCQYEVGSNEHLPSETLLSHTDLLSVWYKYYTKHKRRQFQDRGELCPGDYTGNYMGKRSKLELGDPREDQVHQNAMKCRAKPKPRSDETPNCRSSTTSWPPVRPSVHPNKFDERIPYPVRLRVSTLARLVETRSVNPDDTGVELEQSEFLVISTWPLHIGHVCVHVPHMWKRPHC